MRAALLCVLLWALPACAAVTIHATTTASAMGVRATAGDNGGCEQASGPFAYSYLATSTTAPSSATSEAFAPSSTAPPCVFQRATPFAYFVFVTPPLSGSFTIAGNISAVCSGYESAISLNIGCDMLIYKWDGRRGGLTALIWDSGNTPEFVGASTCSNKAISASAPTSTNVVAGDRLVILPRVETVGGAYGGDGAKTAALCFNGAAAGTNEISVTFTETLTFSADSGTLTTEQVGG